MPNMNHVTNTDRPLARNPRHEDLAAEISPSEVETAEKQSLEEMRTTLARQAEKLDGLAGRAEDAGLVTREELNSVIAQHQAQMQSILAVFEMFQNNDPRRGTPPSADTLEQDRYIYEHTISELHNAPKEAVYIVPLSYEQAAIESSGGQPLYRVICINGIQWPVPVGVMAEVPCQIAEILRHAREGQLGMWRTQQPGPPVMRHEHQPVQDLEQIPRPPRISGSDELGRSGVVGTDVFRPFTNEPNRRLDVR